MSKADGNDCPRIVVQRIYGRSQSCSQLRLRYHSPVCNFARTCLDCGRKRGRERARGACHPLWIGFDKNGPFVSISCAPKRVAGIGPELFGYEKSVSARGVRKIGRIEVAAGGTIFLDAIDNLPLEAQARLLRFLQEGTIESIGGRKPISVATRVIVATRFDLRKAVANRQFRGDLFDRLDGLTLNLPPLQEQGHDILLMAIFFLQQFAAKTGHEKLDILRGTERCIPGSPLGLASLTQQDATPISQDLAGTRANVEAALIRATLKRNRNNIKQSAKEMGISRSHALQSHSQIRHHC